MITASSPPALARAMPVWDSGGRGCALPSVASQAQEARTVWGKPHSIDALHVAFETCDEIHRHRACVIFLNAPNLRRSGAGRAVEEASNPARAGQTSRTFTSLSAPPEASSRSKVKSMDMTGSLFPLSFAVCHSTSNTCTFMATWVCTGRASRRGRREGPIPSRGKGRMRRLPRPQETLN